MNKHRAKERGRRKKAGGWKEASKIGIHQPALASQLNLPCNVRHPKACHYRITKTIILAIIICIIRFSGQSLYPDVRLKGKLDDYICFHAFTTDTPKTLMHAFAFIARFVARCSFVCLI